MYDEPAQTGPERGRGARVTGLQSETGEGLCFPGLVGHYRAGVLSVDEWICQGCVKAFLKSPYIPNVIFKISSISPKSPIVYHVKACKNRNCLKQITKHRFYALWMFPLPTHKLTAEQMQSNIRKLYDTEKN